MKWLIVVALLLAGCTAPLGHEESTPVRDSFPEPHEPEYRPNLWLLDGLRPTSKTVSSGAEPSIVADLNGEYLWIGDTTGAYRSDNNGSDWSKLPNFLLPGVFVDGWALAQGSDGDIWAAALTGSEIEVARSSNGGSSWGQVTRAAAVSGTTDRPWIAVNGADEAVLFYFDAPAVVTGIYEHCARSTDGGVTWLDRDPASGSPQGGNTFFDSEGNFFYVNDRGVISKFDGSCLGTTSTRQMFPAGLGANNMIQGAVDENDVVYVGASGPSSASVKLAGMKGFSLPSSLTVSPEILKSNTFVTVATHGEQVAVGWYGSETAGDPSNPSFNGAFNVWVAVVDDYWGDPQVQHFRITDVPNHVGDICMGGIGCDGSADRDLLDYFMIDYDKWGGLHIAYGHDGTGSAATVRHAHLTPEDIRGFAGVPGAPIAKFSIAATGLFVEVDASESSDAEGDAMTFAWDWGDGSDPETGVQASHLYDSWGAYTIRLVVTDANGNGAETTQNIFVEEATNNRSPTVDFTITPPCPAPGAQVTFTDISTDDGTVIARAWDFGDGTTATGAVATHAFAAGTHTVALEVTDDQGATGAGQRSMQTCESDQTAGSIDGDDAATPAPFAVLAMLAAVVLARRNA